MTICRASLLAALTLLATPALAQENAEEAPPPADSPAPVEDPQADAPPAEAPPADVPSPESAAAATPDAAAAPAGATPAVTPAPIPAAQRAIVASPFSPDQRNGWLTQCRSTFQRAGAALGGANGLPDACETQLLDFERNYVPSADGAPPTIWVRVPRTPAPVVSPAIDGDVE